MDADARPRTGYDTTTTTPDERLPVLDDCHLLTSGRTSNVYLLNDTQVVRRLHDPDASFDNVELIRYLDTEDFPTARLVQAQGPDLVLERLHGPTLLQSLDVQDVSISEGVRILLDLHEALHGSRRLRREWLPASSVRESASSTSTCTRPTSS